MQKLVIALWILWFPILLLSLKLSQEYDTWFGYDPYGLTLATIALFVASAIGLIIRLLKLSNNKTTNNRLPKIALAIILFSQLTQPALQLTAALHPLTLDLYALRFDASAGINISEQLFNFVNDLWPLRHLLNIAYALTPLTMMAFLMKQLQENKNVKVDAMFLWVAMAAFALLAYHLFPMAGPRYIFGDSNFINAIRDSNQFSEIIPVPSINTAPRNGMPSMHFGWVLAVFVAWGLERETKPLTRWLLGSILVLVGMATLYLGEHYVSDLIVAIPFILGAIAFCRNDLTWHDQAKWGTVALGFGTWLIWILLLRHQIVFFQEYPWAAKGLIACTAIVVVAQYRWLSRPVTPLLKIDNAAPEGATEQGDAKTLNLLFFITGFAALTYQVLFAKRLALVFGSTSTATFTVLMAFLGGMAIGSLVGDWLVKKARRPVVLYAIAEICIAVYCVSSLAVLPYLPDFYRWLVASSGHQAWVIFAARIGIGGALLLVPTLLMGTTLPLLVRATTILPRHVGVSTGSLYTSNTLGAALGALLSAYFIIPALGARSSTLLAAVLNLGVALAALALTKREDTLAAPLPSEQAVGQPRMSPPRRDSSVTAVIAGLVLCVGGVLSLGLETVFVHLLSIVAGNSVYAFGLMLATFLLGLSIGGALGTWLIVHTRAPNSLIAIAQLGIALFVTLTCWGWNAIPTYFASFEGYPLATTFASREAIRAIVCALIMIPPTIFIGAGYALAMNAYATATPTRWLTVGKGAALNTVGNISGVILFGFFMLPALGGLDSAKRIAGGSLVLSALAGVMLQGARARVIYGASLGAVIVLLINAPKTLDYSAISSGANVYFQSQAWGDVIDHAESIDGGLTAVTVNNTGGQAFKTLLTNGKFQGNNAVKGEVRAQIGFAVIPLLHQFDRENALVIGYGTGMTSRVLRAAGFAHLDIAEISKDIVDLADTHFSDINDRVSKASRVHLHLADGRNHLLLTDRQYDVVSIEITSIWFAGAASLYNREFYELVKRRLSPHGVLQQWVQLHHMNTLDFLTILATLRSEFRYVSLYVSGGQGILIASNSVETSSPSARAILQVEKNPELDRIFSTYAVHPADLLAGRLVSPSEMDRVIGGFGGLASQWISTDDNLRLEYSTPKANAVQNDTSFERNLKWLESAKVNQQ
ncbi:MAG: hypothetical protein OHK0048_02810 [Rhodoferax sp.]